MKALNEDPKSFKLAITMAGAGSAGCYTGGVMDYLFEILDLWERAKKNNPEILQSQQDKVPKHNVVIDAMGGASAGGMTSTMSAIYALNGQINPVKSPHEVSQPKQNIFYDSWVLMDDDSLDDKRLLFEKVWDLDDLALGKVGSLLNSNFIDKIADKSFHQKVNASNKLTDQTTIEAKTAQLPSYISKDLQLLFSHCLLRGIPLEVNFESAIAKKGRKSVIPNHTTFEHYFVTQYHLNSGKPPDPDQYLWLNPYEQSYADTMKLSTKATGAFPVGLLYREFTPSQFGEPYMKRVLKRIILGELGKAEPDPDKKIELKYFPKNYSSFTVDGGAINNEPYREVLSILKDKYGETPADGYHRYGVVMIDPFPDRAQTLQSYEKPNDMLDVAGGIIGALTDQSRIKRRELLEADASNYFRTILFPRKWVLNDKGQPLRPETTSIACASCMSFGGFLDIRFREHDFFLGRNNARNFFRYYFSFPYSKDLDNPANDIVHPIHADWTETMIDTFKIEKDGKTFLPIIPDMNILLEKENGLPVMQYKYDIPKMPLFDPSSLFALRGQMEKRILRIIELVSDRDYSEEKAATKAREIELLPDKDKIVMQRRELEMNAKTLEADKWMKQYYPKNFFSKAVSLVSKPFFLLVFSFGKKILARKITKKAIQAILKDLSDKGLLKYSLEK